MKILTMKQHDGKGKEIADALFSLGMSRIAAMTLAYLQNTNVATSLDLEIAARLRQPEVSIAMKELNKLDWITEREEKKPGRGRPQKFYSLKVDFNEIIVQLETQQSKAVDEVQAKIERLKELGK